MPSDTELTHALEEAVEELFDEDPGNVRPKAVRAKAEEKLRLQSGFYASSDEWRERSKDVLQKKFEQLLNSAEDADSHGKKRKSSESGDEEAAQPPPKKRATVSKSTKEKPKPKPSAPAKRPRPKKQASPPSSALEKDSGNELDVGIPVREPPKPAKSPSEVVKDDPAAHQPVDEGLDDSDLSSLLDEAPPPKAARKKKGAPSQSEPKGASKPKAKPKKTMDSAASPQDAELKELQSQLLQCGVRKIWAMHLAKFDSHKEKVGELKRMLREVGMEGRFSKEKARQIKETRELQADIQAIQEGEGKWGKQDEKPRKAAGRAQTNIVDFDDEESD